MTTLQEAVKKFIEATKLDRIEFEDWPRDSQTAFESLRTALAQQGEQAKPVAYITDTHQGPMVWTPEMYDEACTYCDDGEFPVPLYTAAPAQKPIGYVTPGYFAFGHGMIDERQDEAKRIPVYAAAPAPQAQEHNADPSCTTVELAEMILSDCGCSSNNTLLVSRVVNRIDAHMQSAQPVAPQQASTGMMYIEQAAYAKAKERYGVKAVKMRCQGFDLALPIIEESDGYVVVADTRPAQTNRTLTDAERLERERERERERNR